MAKRVRWLSRSNLPTAAGSERPESRRDVLDARRHKHVESLDEQLRVESFVLSAALRELADAVGKSRSIVGLGNDWDGEGSPGYEEATWHRAAQLLVESGAAFWRTYRAAPPAPNSTPGPDGSIDMVWQAENRKLAINIPAEPDCVATFYGKDRGDENGFVRGEIGLSRSGEWLLAWLAR